MAAADQLRAVSPFLSVDVDTRDFRFSTIFGTGAGSGLLTNTRVGESNFEGHQVFSRRRSRSVFTAGEAVALGPRTGVSSGAFSTSSSAPKTAWRRERALTGGSAQAAAPLSPPAPTVPAVPPVPALPKDYVSPKGATIIGEGKLRRPRAVVPVVDGAVAASSKSAPRPSASFLPSCSPRSAAAFLATTTALTHHQPGSRHVPRQQHTLEKSAPLCPTATLTSFQSPVDRVTDSAVDCPRPRTSPGLPRRDLGRDSDSDRRQQPPRPEDDQEEARVADEVARFMAETDRIFAESWETDLERLHEQIGLGPEDTAAAPVSKPNKFSFLLRRSNRADPATASASPSPTPTSTPSSSPSPPNSSRGPSVESETMPRNFIEAGERGQVDAPRSAINAGDRIVTVKWENSALALPVRPETSALDLLKDCLNQVPRPVDPASSTVVEIYAKLGLERRLRLYERVRDVMNSWDRDTQNTLLVMPSGGGPETDSNLDIASVPRTQEAPEGFVLQMYHSQRPGKWNKRYVSLMENGQIYCSKKPDGKTTDKDMVSMCRLTDFDIYNPTEAQMRKTLKPPKKYCYAVKSQEKTTVFLSTENFVHFFCTDDPSVARQFHSAVHAWRSWYLVSQLPASRVTPARKKADVVAARPDEKPSQVVPTRHNTQKTVGHVKVDGHHRVKVSVDESPYSLGTFKPLLDLGRFDKPLEDYGEDWEPEAKAVAEDKPKRSATLRKKPPPEASSASSPITPIGPSSPRTSKQISIKPSKGGSAFAAGGLLGSGYEERKKEAMAKDAVQTGYSPTDPFSQHPTQRPTLLNGSGAQATTYGPDQTAPEAVTSPTGTWFPSATEHTARQRSHTVGNGQGAPPRRQPSTTRSVQNSRPPPALNQQQQMMMQQMMQQQQLLQQQYFQPQHPSQHRPGTSSRQPQPPAPLLDLTPQFQEPPQWTREGRGHGVKVPTGVPLVDMATGRKDVNARPMNMDGPPQAPFRRDAKPVPPPITRSQQQADNMSIYHSGGCGSSTSGRSRSRSQSVAAAAAGGMRTSPTEDRPPVPPMPHIRATSRDRTVRAEDPRARTVRRANTHDERVFSPPGMSGMGMSVGRDKATAAAAADARGRDPRPREHREKGGPPVSLHGRAGTLKYC